MKKQFFAIILSVFFVNALAIAAPTVSAIQTDESSFYSIPAGETIATYRSFHTEIFENGDNERQNITAGNGDFSTFDSAYDVDPNWVVNTTYDFTLSYDLSGNIEFFVDGVGILDGDDTTLPLVYQPLNAINQIFIANDNDTGSSFQDMEMREMVFESGSDAVVLADLVTSGPSGFQGIIISNLGDTWELRGKVIFGSDVGQIAHQSSFKFHGAVPESSAYGVILGLISIAFVFIQKRK